MRASVIFLMATASLLMLACGNGKVYQEYTDFETRSWLISDTAQFQFTIEDSLSLYNVYCNVRNSTQYPYSRIFMEFSLTDSSGNALHKALLNDFLFNPKTGEPLGKTGLGDLYDHQLSVLKNHKFEGSGPYVINLGQFMRKDTLEGILSVGIEIEKAE